MPLAELLGRTFRNAPLCWNVSRREIRQWTIELATPNDRRNPAAMRHLNPNMTKR